ncbi:MAG: endonuclease/exonuclease/phosphatase family protein [Pseudomonadota bacterium]
MLPLKIMTWNVEHFNGRGGKSPDKEPLRKGRLNRIVDFIKDEEPDIFALSEVTTSLVYTKMVAAFPNHTFHITTGQQSQEILIGVRPGLGSFFTQKDEFKRNNIYLRPGALLTVKDGDLIVPILFVHLKSMPSAEGFGLRDAMYDKIYSLKKALDKAAKAMPNHQGAAANFIVLGDYNSMGLDYYRRGNDISGNREIEVLTRKMNARGMRKPLPSHPFTYNNGSQSDLPLSELDHLFAAEHLEFETSAEGHEVRVAGWNLKNTAAKQDKWIEKFSDHAPLIATLTGVGS